MSKAAMIKTVAAGFLLVGVLAAAAGAQTSQTPEPRAIRTGLFTVTQNEQVNFHVLLDDVRTNPASRVLLRLYDQNGAVVARQEVTLRPGQGTTLQHFAPGLYRAFAQVLDRTSSCERRTLRGTVEIYHVATDTVRMQSASDDGRSDCLPQ